MGNRLAGIGDGMPSSVLFIIKKKASKGSLLVGCSKTHQTHSQADDAEEYAVSFC